MAESEAQVQESGDDSAAKGPLAATPFWYWAALTAIVALALALRVWRLGEMFLWHDESVNGRLVRDIVRSFEYRYEAHRFHGPLLFYLQALVTAWAGESHEALRSISVAAGVALVASAALFRTSIGRPGSLFAALGFAIAPAELFYSRVAIHEMLFLALSAGFVGFGWRWIELQTARAQVAARHRNCMLICLGGMLATKETVVLTLGAVVCGILAVWLGTGAAGAETALGADTVPDPKDRLDIDARTGLHSSLGTAPVPNPGTAPVRDTGTAAAAAQRRGLRLHRRLVGSIRLQVAPMWAAVRARIREDRRGLARASAAVLVGLMLLYSSFFTHPAGVLQFLASVFVWAGNSVSQRHLHQPFYYFLKLLVLDYWPFFFTAAIGLTAGCLRRDRRALFLAGWASSIIAVYSLIPYKTPWCVTSLGLPLVLGSGYTFQSLRSAAGRGAVRAVIGLAFFASLLPLSVRALTFSYARYDDSTVELVWAPTHREFRAFLEEVPAFLEAQADDGVLPQLLTWFAKDPLVWYLGDYPSERLWVEGRDSRAWREQILRADVVIADRWHFHRVRKLLAAKWLGRAQPILEAWPKPVVLSDEELAVLDAHYVFRRYREAGRHDLFLFAPKAMWARYVGILEARGQVPPPTLPIPAGDPGKEPRLPDGR